MCFQRVFLQFQQSHTADTTRSPCSTNRGWNGTNGSTSKSLLPLSLFSHKPPADGSKSCKLFRKKHQVHPTTHSTCSHSHPSLQKQKTPQREGNSQQVQQSPTRQVCSHTHFKVILTIYLQNFNRTQSNRLNSID